MTRPGIIRADTIDLQDQDAPSAQDHTKKHVNGAAGHAAPHQAAELRHVQQERRGEEAALSNAWGNAQGLRDEPPSEDEDMYTDGDNMDGEALLHQNGDLLGPADGSDAGDEDDALGDDMERQSSSPSITDEDIDFEFVYALHNFVATVEGQANAAKGDTMVLLDDSNSYWWLVRVVKDNTIGYLPAEHIETPTERLARLNKHRNIDATKMHFEDSLEKPKNPIKRVIRRRNQKNVTFADPTYRDAPIYDFSSDEEEDMEDEGEGKIETNGESTQSQVLQENGIEEDTDEITTVAPLNVRSAANQTQSQATQDPGLQMVDDEKRAAMDEPRTSDETERVGPGRSRNGTVRNTDSFFKDDTVETRKITITPKLLREDNGLSAEARTSDSSQRAGSFDMDKLDRKEDKSGKKKNLFNLFKRKDKGDKKSKDDLTGSNKSSSEISRDSVGPPPDTGSPGEKSSLENSLNRKGSKGKLQKAQPNTQARNTMSPINTRSSQIPNDQGLQDSLNADSPRDTVVAGQRASPDKQGTGNMIQQTRNPESGPMTLQSSNPYAQTNGVSHVSRLVTSDAQPDALSESPVHVTVEDAHPDAEPPALVRDTSSDSDDVRSLRDSPSPPIQNGLVRDGQRHQDSTVTGHSPVSPISTSAAKFGGAAALGAAAIGGAAMLTNGGPPPPNRSPPPQPNGVISPFTSLTSPGTAPDRQNSTSTTTSAMLSSAPSTPVWSDASLRQYLDESGSADIRDLLLLTRDTTGVVPVSHDHPLMAGLYTEERGKVKEMDTMLNGLLGTWLDRKMRSKSSMSQRKRVT